MCSTNIRCDSGGMSIMQYHRGDIVWVDLPVGVGSEQGHIRPAVIIQNEVGNKNSPCIIVALMTSKNKKEMITHVNIRPTIETGLIKPTTVMCEQIKTVDKSRVLSWAGKVSDRMMECIDRAVMSSLGLTNYYTV